MTINACPEREVGCAVVDCTAWSSSACLSLLRSTCQVPKRHSAISAACSALIPVVLCVVIRVLYMVRNTRSWTVVCCFVFT
jgi:di/tricarboxylate transporter